MMAIAFAQVLAQVPQQETLMTESLQDNEEGNSVASNDLQAALQASKKICES